MNHSPTPIFPIAKNSKNKRILAVHVIRILQFSLIPIDGRHILSCYTFLFPPQNLFMLCVTDARLRRK